MLKQLVIQLPETTATRYLPSRSPHLRTIKMNGVDRAWSATQATTGGGVGVGMAPFTTRTPTESMFFDNCKSPARGDV